jgi:hypothetical protein
LTGSSDEKAQLWDVATLKPIGSPLHHPPAWVNGVAFSPDGKMVVTGGFDLAARRWEVATGNEIDPPLRHDDEVRAVVFSPDGKTILAGSFDQTARLWDAATGKPLGLPLRHPDRIHAVAFSPDGEIIVTGGADQKAHRWRASTGEPLGPPLQHQGEVTAVTFSPDGRMIMTGSTDQTARLWDAATGSALGPPFYHRAPVVAVTVPAFDRSGANGFRCVRYISGEMPPAALNDILAKHRDYEKEKPVSDEVFELCKNPYAYDKTPLHARIESIEESTESIHQTITFDAAYGKERVIVHLYLPHRGTRPQQTVIVFPGDDYFVKRSFPRENPPRLVGNIVRTGRAVLWPLYKGSCERWDEEMLNSNWSMGRSWMTAMTQSYQDLARSVDSCRNAAISTATSSLIMV